jgi:hypothetical protein
MAKVTTDTEEARTTRYQITLGRWNGRFIMLVSHATAPWLCTARQNATAISRLQITLGRGKKSREPLIEQSLLPWYIDAKLIRIEYDMAGDVETMLWSDASCGNGVHTWRRLGVHPCPSSGPGRLCVQEHESHAENVDSLKERNDDEKVKKMKKELEKKKKVWCCEKDKKMGGSLNRCWEQDKNEKQTQEYTTSIGVGLRDGAEANMGTRMKTVTSSTDGREKTAERWAWE